MSPEQNPGAQGQPTDDAQAAPEHRAPITRTRAVVYLVLTIAFLTAGVVTYRLRAPRIDIVRIELGGGSQLVSDPRDVRQAVLWDFALIAGYGLALLFAGLLARAVFRTATTETEKRTGGWRRLLGPLRHPAREPVGAIGPLGRLALPLAAIVVGADVLEDVFLLSGISASGSLSPRLLDLATASSILKWAMLAPAALISIAAVTVTMTRLQLNGSIRRRAGTPVAVRPPDPLEGDPPAPGGDGTGAARWRRGYRVPDVDASDQREPVLGVCLSGGGIRSGSVALGALQAMRPDVLRARYLVSVSGGGYTAGALQLALTSAGDPTHQPAGEVLREPATTYMPGSVEEDRLRRHARYLADSPAEMLRALGVASGVFVVSLFVLFAPAAVLGAAVGALYRAVPLAPIRDRGGLHVPQVPAGTWLLLAALAGLAFLAYLVMLFRLAYTPRMANRSRQTAYYAVVAGLFVAAVSVGLPWLIYWAGRLLEVAPPTSVRWGGPVLGAAVTYMVTLGSFVRRKKLVEKAGGLFRKKGGTVGAVPGGAVQLLLVAVVLVLLVAGWLILMAGVAASATGPARVTTLISAGGALVLLLALGFLLDQTTLSLHPFYRRKLAEAFSARRVRRSDGYLVAEGYSYDEATPLPAYGKRVDGFPEVVFAAAANLTGERRAPLNASSFTFGATWIGGPDVGYVSTGELSQVVGYPVGRDLTVQAAMAVSGAAVASAAGRASRWYTTLLAVTGLRLGTWLPNPAFVSRWNAAAETDDWTLPGLPRMRRLTYLVREVFGIHRWTDRMLQITDGGHYENLGLMEALRRRCTEIYCIDASGDPPPTAATFAEAITLAYAELGVRITVHEDIWHLVAGSGDGIKPDDALAGLNKRLSDQAVVTATIQYPPESGLPEGKRRGTLVMAKALLRPTMSYDLLSYAACNDVFPHDSTGDQFFQDDKFIAYSSLGREIGGFAMLAMAAARARAVTEEVVGAGQT